MSNTTLTGGGTTHPSPVAGRFVYDDPTHTYTLAGRRLPSVTEVVKAAGLVDYSNVDPAVLAHAAQRGRAVHSACQFFDENDLDWDTVIDEVKPYVEAWERFSKDNPFEWADIEKPLYHATYGFAGTPDRIVHCNGRKVVVDIKTFSPSPETGVQLAGYSFLRFGPQPFFDAPDRLAVWLKNDGKYQLTRYDDRGDERIFFCCLDLFKWKEAKQ